MISMNEEQRKLARQEKKRKLLKKSIITSIISFIIANIYIILAAIFWDASKVANFLLTLNGFLIFVPAVIFTIISMGDWAKICLGIETEDYY